MAYRLAGLSNFEGLIEANASILVKALREIDYFISMKKLKIWLSTQRAQLANRRFIAIHEFLYLLAN